MVLDRPLGHAQRVGDLLVGKAARHQPQDLGLALGQRVRPIEADEVVAHVFQPRQQALGDGRLHQRTTAGDRLDRADQLLQRHVLEQVALGAGLDPGQYQLVVVEGGEDDRRRQALGAGQCLQGLQARHHRHPHIHQHHVGFELRDDLERLAAVAGLADDLDAVGQRQQCSDALAYQRLVVHQQHADGVAAVGVGRHGVTPSQAAMDAEAGRVS